ncbi:MAG: hypothetical protein AB7O21_11985 [Gammaproteobacteria bacterium]
MRNFLEHDPKLRPWWHVGVPFWIGALMVAGIGIAGRNPLALLLTAVFAAWGLWWALKARHGARRHAQAIAQATGMLDDPTADHALWLGPAVLQLRPRRAGHLLWTRDGLTWTTTDAAALADPARRVLTGAFAIDLSFRSGSIIDLRHTSGVLSGDRLAVVTADGEEHRFRLQDPATYSFIVRALDTDGGR